jgi:hypothetical protein
VQEGGSCVLTLSLASAGPLHIVKTDSTSVTSSVLRTGLCGIAGLWLIRSARLHSRPGRQPVVRQFWSRDRAIVLGRARRLLDELKVQLRALGRDGPAPDAVLADGPVAYRKLEAERADVAAGANLDGFSGPHAELQRPGR